MRKKHVIAKPNRKEIAPRSGFQDRAGASLSKASDSRSPLLAKQRRRCPSPPGPKAEPGAYFALAEALDDAPVDAVSIEDAHRPNDLALLDRETVRAKRGNLVAAARSVG